MKHSKIFRTLALAIILALLVVAIPVTPALAQTIYVYPSYGPVGTVVSISGSSFTPSSTCTITFGTVLVRTNVPTDSIGSFDTTFFVPVYSRGDYLVTVKDASYVSRSTVFTVTPQITTLSPSSGYVGSTVTVSGTGFNASSSVTIYFDTTAVSTATATTSGTFSGATFTVPASYRGSHTVKVIDASNNYDTATFTTTQSITISPTSGVVGDKVTVTGTGFQANKSITITYNAAEVITSPATVTTDANGSFSGSFLVPTSVTGTYKVEASDATYKASADFTASASISLSQTSGYVGTKITVSGAGFIANKSITITFANVQVGTTTTDANGSFSGSFLVPTRVTGTYKVEASDATYKASADFTILTSATLNPTTGHVGTPLTVSGIGFIVGGTVTITYDALEVATATPDTNGAFSVTFPATASTGGDHTITVTDGTNIKQFTFTMESTPPPIPVPLLPFMNSKAKAQAYFDWEDVTDPSLPITYTLQIASDANFTTIVLKKEGLTTSEYTITKEEKLPSVKKEAPYYWRVRAIDSASNEGNWSGTGSFYVGFIFEMPNWTIYTLFGFGALLLGALGFWLGRRTAYL